MIFNRPLIAAAFVVATILPATGSDCATELADILTRSAFAGPFHVDSRVVSPAGEQRIRGDVVPRQSVHLMVLIDGGTSEIIATNGEGWLNAGRGWTSLPVDMAWSLPSRFGIAVVEDVAAPQDPACLGLTTHDGKEYLAFTYAHARDGHSGAYRILVDPVSMLQVRVDSVLTSPDAQATTTTVEYDYDPGVSIARPAL